MSRPPSAIAIRLPAHRTKAEVLGLARHLRDDLATMAAEQLKFNEIKEADRAPPRAVYDKGIELLNVHDGG